MKNFKKIIAGVLTAIVLMIGALAYHFWPAKDSANPPSLSISYGKFSGMISGDLVCKIPGLYAFTDSYVESYDEPDFSESEKRDLKSGIHLYHADVDLTMKQVLDYIEPSYANKVLIAHFNPNRENPNNNENIDSGFSVYPELEGQTKISDPASYTIPKNQGFLIMSCENTKVWKIKDENTPGINDYDYLKNALGNTWVLFAVPDQQAFQSVLSQYDAKIKSVWVQKGVGFDFEPKSTLNSGYYMAWLRLEPPVNKADNKENPKGPDIPSGTVESCAECGDKKCVFYNFFGGRPVYTCEDQTAFPTPNIIDKTAIENSIVLSIGFDKLAVADLKNFQISYTNPDGSKTSYSLDQSGVINQVGSNTIETFFDDKNELLIVSLNDLAENQEYSVEVIAESKDGKKSSPATFKLTTETKTVIKEIPAPQITEQINLGSGKMKIGWELPGDEYGKSLFGYKVLYRNLVTSKGTSFSIERNGYTTDQNVTVVSANLNHLVITVSGLNTKVDYLFQIKGVNKNKDEGDPSTTVIKGGETFNDQAADKKVIDLEGDSFINGAKLEWTATSSTGYKIYYYSVYTKQFEEVKILAPNEAPPKFDATKTPPEGFYTYGIKDMQYSPGKKQAIVYGFDVPEPSDYIFKVKGNLDTDYSNQVDVKVQPKKVTDGDDVVAVEDEVPLEITKVEYIKFNTVNVYWKSPKTLNGNNVFKFSIVAHNGKSCKDLSGDVQIETLEISSSSEDNTYHQKVINLINKDDYFVYVRAIANGGNVLESDSCQNFTMQPGL